MPLHIWIILGVSALLLLGMTSGLIMTLGIIKPKRRSLLETSMLEEEKYPGIMSFYQKHLTDQYTIQSRYGYDLAVYYMKNPIETNAYIVMSHGHTYTHHGCLKYAKMMIKHGYNVVLYDQRYHGASGGNNTSLGYYEKDDLFDLITDTFSRYGEEIEIATYGESMGAATVLLEAAEDPRVQYVFADCGFSNLDRLIQEIIRKKVKWLWVPGLFLTRLTFRWIMGVSMSRISPKDALTQLHIPIFFAHGKADRFISVKHTVDMYESYHGNKLIFLADHDAGHAESYLKDGKQYEEYISKFIDEYINK